MKEPTAMQAQLIADARSILASLSDLQAHALMLDRSDAMPIDRQEHFGNCVGRQAHLRARKEKQ